MYTMRPNRAALPGIFLFLFFAADLFADTPRLAVTVYNHDLGLVRERRVLDLERGETVYSFTGVAARIDPTSVHFRPVDGKGGLEVLEQNFEYDLVSGEKIYEKYLDHPVEVFFARSGDLLEGVLLSARGGTLVLQDREGGRLSVVQSDVRNIELKGDASDFVTRPTLVWMLRNEKAGEREVEVEYLTGGMGWHAEYVAVADEKNENIDFAGWVSVENRSGAEYADAKLKLVAGDVGRADAGRRPEMRADVMYAAKAAPDMEERSLFEYHLYELKRPTTIRKNQVKQVSFIPNTKTPVVKEYLYEPRRHPEKVGVFFEFRNDEKSGLGIALPAGLVRIFQDDGRGGSEFIGEDRIDHTPRNEEVRLRIGSAFDIVAERKVLGDKRIFDKVRERTVEIRLRNRKDEAVEVKVLEQIEGDWTIERESFEHRKESAWTAEWTIPVGPDGEAVLEYTARIRY